MEFSAVVEFGASAPHSSEHRRAPKDACYSRTLAPAGTELAYHHFEEFFPQKDKVPEIWMHSPGLKQIKLPLKKCLLS